MAVESWDEAYDGDYEIWIILFWIITGVTSVMSGALYFFGEKPECEWVFYISVAALYLNTFKANKIVKSIGGFLESCVDEAIKDNENKKSGVGKSGE